MLESFQKKVETIAEEYSELLLKKIENGRKEKTFTSEELNDINEGIRMLNHVTCTMERIDRLQHGNTAGGLAD